MAGTFWDQNLALGAKPLGGNEVPIGGGGGAPGGGDQNGMGLGGGGGNPPPVDPHGGGGHGIGAPPPPPPDVNLRSPQLGVGPAPPQHGGGGMGPLGGGGNPAGPPPAPPQHGMPPGGGGGPIGDPPPAPQPPIVGNGSPMGPGGNMPNLPTYAPPQVPMGPPQGPSGGGMQPNLEGIPQGGESPMMPGVMADMRRRALGQGDQAGPNLGQGGPGGPGGPPAPPDIPQTGHGELDQVLKGLMGGQMNQDIVNSRVDQAKGTLEKNRQSNMATQDAQLAERGLLGSGPEALAMQKLNQGSSDDLNNAVSGIFADESGKADARMMQALTTSAGLSVSDAQNMVDRMNADTNRQNVTGNIANNQGRLALDTSLGNRGLDIQKEGQDKNYNVQSGRLGLDTELGRGDLDVKRRGLDQDLQLGNKGLDIQKSLGDANIGVQNRGLGIQEKGQQLDWNKFMAGFGLDRERLGMDEENSNTSGIMALLQQLYGGAGTSSGGYV